MSAEILRRAASLMRERADAATEGGWEAFRQYDADHRAEFYGVCSEWIGDLGKDVFRDRDADPADVEHIAAWHPAVALAVADWLDAEATNRDNYIRRQSWDVSGPTSAEIVARAYLGESA